MSKAIFHRWTFFRSLVFLLLLALISCVSLKESPGPEPVPGTPPAVSQPAAPAALDLKLPLIKGSVRFAAIGDSGTGDSEQYEVAELMTRYHEVYPFEFVLMMGDNLYGDEKPEDYREKFEIPFQELLSREVKFYASLGNHDEPAQRFYKHFNMKGNRYYTFKKGNVRFYALDSDYMDPQQLKWIDQQTKEDQSEWEIAFFHHPIYSSGRRHGPDEELREVLEPVFTANGIDAVFSGHEHFYERLYPQNGIYYFITGAAAKLREDNISVTPNTARGFDEDRSFTLVEIMGSEMFVQTISRQGRTVDFARLSLLRASEPVSDK